MYSNLLTMSQQQEANFSSAKATTKRSKKDKQYTLRACSIQKRMETEHRNKMPRKRGPKPRPKSAPMSKYRRKTANLRERQRMGEINVAFDKLRDKLPSPISLKNGGKCEKLTKINILHIAINYIRAMENLLETGDSGVRSFKEMTKNPIRDDKNRKLEVQKVLEALMKRTDSSRPNSRVLKMLKSEAERQVKQEGFGDDDDDDGIEDSESPDEEESPSFPEWTALSSSLDTSSYSSFNSSISSLDSSSLDNFSSSSAAAASSSPSTLFKEPDPLFSSSMAAVVTQKMKLENNNDLSPLIHPGSGASSTSLNSTAPPPGSGGGGGDDIMLKDFTDFVEMVDSLNGMPDIEFVQDSFEMFP